ncbi:DNA translocase FtsK [bacterium]|nr:MAG: DNA translocase FtsK [bacterium]
MAAPTEQLLQLKVRREHLEPLARLVSHSQKWHAWAVDDAQKEALRQNDESERETAALLQEKERAFDEKLKLVRRTYEAESQGSKRAFELKSQDLERQLRELTHRFSWGELPWDAPDWDNFDSRDVLNVPSHSRLGEFMLEGRNGSWRVPALIPLIGSNNVLFKAPGADKDRAHMALQALMLRLLASLPPGKLRLTMLDPIGLGANMAGFMKLPDALTGGRIWTEANHIERQLVDLSEHMEKVIQKYLLNRFSSMQEFNEQAGRVQEPYRVLAVANFPANFSDSAARRLLSIATNGPRTGVYVLGVIDPSMKLPYGFDLGELERHATVIEASRQQFFLNVPGLHRIPIELDSPPPQPKEALPESPEEGARERGATLWTNSLFDRICRSVAEESVAVGIVRIPFSDIEPALDWEKTSTSELLQIPLGCFGAHDVQQLTFGVGTEHSALIIGKTGSGKSSLLHVMVLAAAMKYSPDELEMYLLDLKQVEFVDYADAQLPHARVVAMQSEREFGLSVLQGLADELKRRQDRFQGIATNLKEFRASCPGEAMPRILLVVDEFQELFNEEDKIAADSSMILDRLVRLGRAFGIHVVLATQSLSGKNVLSTSTKEQMAVRIALQCSESDSRQILADDNPAARLLERPGEAIYNARNGLVEGNNSFQAVYLNKDERRELIERISGKANSQPQWRNRPPMIVFRGKEPARVAQCSPLTTLVAAKEVVQSPVSLAFLGSAVAIKPPTAAPLRRQSRNNLLIVGQQEESATGMLAASLIGLAARYRSNDAQFFVGDWTDVDLPYHGMLEQVVQGLPHKAKMLTTRSLPQTLNDIARLVDERVKNEITGGEAIFLVLNGLHRPRDLRREEGGNYRNYSFEETPTKNSGDSLAQIVRDGPEVGVHTLAWADTVASLERVVSRRELVEWQYRVVFPMGASESNTLLDSSVAAKLQHPFAFFYDEDRASQLEKFNPYGVPNSDWIQTTLATLRQRSNASTN